MLHPFCVGKSDQTCQPVNDGVNNKSNHTYLSVCLFNTNGIFSVEDWLKQNHREVYDSYECSVSMT